MIPGVNRELVSAIKAVAGVLGVVATALTGTQCQEPLSEGGGLRRSDLRRLFLLGS